MYEENAELKGQRAEVLLYRCECKHCDEALEILRDLAKEYGAQLDVRRVRTEMGLEDWAGWRTPVVYINGRQISHYEINAKKWRETLKAGRAAVPSVVIGEIVDLHCYMNTKIKGGQHKRCADECIGNGQPIGLATRDGQLYLVIEDNAYVSSYESLKKLAAEEVRITGDICERGGVQAIIVRNVEAISPGMLHLL